MNSTTTDNCGLLQSDLEYGTTRYTLILSCSFRLFQEIFNASLFDSNCSFQAEESSVIAVCPGTMERLGSLRATPESTKSPVPLQTAAGGSEKFHPSLKES